MTFSLSEQDPKVILQKVSAVKIEKVKKNCTIGVNLSCPMKKKLICGNANEN